jgi:hypothetical protein
VIPAAFSTSGSGRCPITDVDTKDTVWIPVVTRHNWLVITRDSKIQGHRREIAAVRDAGARMIALTSPDARGAFAQLETVMCRWRDIESKLSEPGPFIYAATRTRLHPVPLD